MIMTNLNFDVDYQGEYMVHKEIYIELRIRNGNLIILTMIEILLEQLYMMKTEYSIL